MAETEYLLTFGNFGEFSRFRTRMPTKLRRGDRVVVRSERGLELGTVLRARVEDTSVWEGEQIGEILRPASPEDVRAAQRLRDRSQTLYDDSRRLVRELALPVEILDAELLLDGERAFVHYVEVGECDLRALMDGLSAEHKVLVTMHAVSTGPPSEEPPVVCGSRGGCGDGGCESCSARPANVPAVPRRHGDL
jgi:cell fate regulator YaaT (PSP1 superfamily)